MQNTFSLLTWFFLATLFNWAQAASENKGYIGSSACQSCHQDSYKDWLGSHHDMAMRHAKPESVLADFNDAKLVFNNKTNRFYQKEDQYWVNIEGPDGKFHDYQILYTFGFTPLQQYMVELKKGHIQLIPFAWDSRPKKDGGQRWFNLYPKEDQYDDFFWTNKGQNWNFMCADCHSTNLEKNYNPTDNSYKSTWSEINIGCEACHGPAKKHIELAKAHEKDSKLTWDKNYGFSLDLNKSVQEWIQEEGKTTLQPKSITKTDQVKVCAQCHSRRIQLNETQQTTDQSLLDHYLPSLITPDLYHDDGQIFDEDYVYGSFMQTKMHQKGVVCTNCHNPHSTKLNIPKETVCNQCHIATHYSEENHTFHKKGTPGSECVDCHMPATTYMQVDPRRDHSWQIPRPDLSEKINTPNACTTCHQDKDNAWASKQVKEWFPNSNYQNQEHFATAFYAADNHDQVAGNKLAYISQDIREAGIIRGSALERLSHFPSKNAIISIARAIKNKDPLIRLGAINASSPYQIEHRFQILEPLLKDPILSVRAQAAGALSPYWQQLTPEQQKAMQPALDDYIKIQQFNQDRGFGRTNLANIDLAKGEIDKAIQGYQSAIEIEPTYANSYINLADIYRQQGDNQKSLESLELGIKNQPKSGLLRYSVALAYIRLQQSDKALTNLDQAVSLDPDNDQFWYVYALAYENTDFTKTKIGLSKAFDITKSPQYLYSKCELEKKHQDDDFSNCIKQLEKIAPKDIIDKLIN